MNKIVSVKNLSKCYGKKVVLDNLSFDLKPGRIIGLLGENGVGKTTIIKILANLVKADKGTVHINGKLVSSKTHSEISYMMDISNIYSWMRIKDAIHYFQDMYQDFIKDKALAICEELELNPNELIRKLSKGNQERVLLMLALSRRVPLYLLDEPVGGLDPRTKKSIINIILSYIEEDSTVLISSHLLKDLDGIFDEIFILHNHKITAILADDIRENFNESVEDYYLEVTNHA